MRTFTVYGSVTVSCWTEVDAPNEEEAIRLAGMRGMADFHIDGSSPVDETWHMENDGTPQGLRIED